MLEGTKGLIRPQDNRDIVDAMSSTPNGLDVLIDFLVSNLKNIISNIMDGNDLVKYIYSTCASKAALDNEIIRVRKICIN